MTNRIDSNENDSNNNSNNSNNDEYLHLRDLSCYSKLPRAGPQAWSVGTALNPESSPYNYHQCEFAGEAFSLQGGLGESLILESEGFIARISKGALTHL